MQDVILISFGELMLKGRNRNHFIHRASQKIKAALEGHPVQKIYLDMGKLVVEHDQGDVAALVQALGQVFGLATLVPALQVEKTREAIAAGAQEVARRRGIQAGQTFKAEVQRADKNFRPKSPELAAHLGGVLLKTFSPRLKVDVHQPDFVLKADIRNQAYLSTQAFEGLGGLPLGSSGRGLVLLSGGIDSPVAAFHMAKRGVQLAGVHFHSYPFTSQQGFEKTLDLARELTFYTGDLVLHSINLLKVYEELNRQCNPRYLTILSRRMMMRIAEAISRERHYQMLITGEALGQVASQTIEGIHCVEEATSYPVLRPLIGMDKKEIMATAKEIGTFDISIRPFDDCCSVFTPDNPVTKPRMEVVHKEEEKVDIGGLVQEALATRQVQKIEEDI